LNHHGGNATCLSRAESLNLLNDFGLVPTPGLVFPLEAQRRKPNILIGLLPLGLMLLKNLNPDFRVLIIHKLCGAE